MNARVAAATAGALAAAALLAAGSAQAAAPVPPVPPAPRTLALTAVQTEVHLDDVKPKGPSVGDRTTFAEDLFTPGPVEKRGARLGTDGGECVVTSVTKTKQGMEIVVSGVTTQCAATLALKGGQVTVQGLASYGWKARDTFTLAITGGTGSYTGARGTMTVTGSATATTSDLALAYTAGGQDAR
jgi:hypothetical protein